MVPAFLWMAGVPREDVASQDSPRFHGSVHQATQMTEPSVFFRNACRLLWSKPGRSVGDAKPCDRGTSPRLAWEVVEPSGRLGFPRRILLALGCGRGLFAAGVASLPCPCRSFRDHVARAVRWPWQASDGFYRPLNLDDGWL
jgi:hypothetical protein